MGIYVSRRNADGETWDLMGPFGPIMSGESRGVVGRVLHCLTHPDHWEPSEAQEVADNIMKDHTIERALDRFDPVSRNIVPLSVICWSLKGRAAREAAIREVGFAAILDWKEQALLFEILREGL